MRIPKKFKRKKESTPTEVRVSVHSHPDYPGIAQLVLNNQNGSRLATLALDIEGIAKLSEALLAAAAQYVPSALEPLTEPAADATP